MGVSTNFGTMNMDTNTNKEGNSICRLIIVASPVISAIITVCAPFFPSSNSYHAGFTTFYSTLWGKALFWYGLLGCLYLFYEEIVFCLHFSLYTVGTLLRTVKAKLAKS